MLEQQRIAANAKRCLKVAEHNRDRPNDTCVLMINTIVYDLSLRESPFNNDTGGYEDTESFTLDPFGFSSNFQLPPPQASQGLVDARERETREVCERGMMGTSAERKQGMMGKKREKQLLVSVWLVSLPIPAFAPAFLYN